MVYQWFTDGFANVYDGLEWFTMVWRKFRMSLKSYGIHAVAIATNVKSMPFSNLAI